MHEVDVDRTGAVIIDGERIGAFLTRQEEDVFRTILSHSHVATKWFIFDNLYAGGEGAELKIIDVVVCKIRRKLGDHRDAIATVWGRGYAKGSGYTLRPANKGTIAVRLNASLVEDAIQAHGEQPEAYLTRLINEDLRRTLSVAA